MKKKVLILAGLLSCLMMVFSIQADDATKRSHSIVLGEDPSMPGHGCEGRDLKLECPQTMPKDRDGCCEHYCTHHEGECIVE